MRKMNRGLKKQSRGGRKDKIEGGRTQEEWRKGRESKSAGKLKQKSEGRKRDKKEKE